MKKLLLCAIGLCSLSLYGSDKSAQDYTQKDDQVQYYMNHYSNPAVARPAQPSLLQKLAIERLAKGEMPKSLEEIYAATRKTPLALGYAAMFGIESPK